MGIKRYTCTACGIVTRVEDGQDHKACQCEAPFDVVNDEEEPMLSRGTNGADQQGD